MNRDDIIRMARVEGVFVESSAWLTPTPDLEERVYQFAALVAAAEREAWANNTTLKLIADWKYMVGIAERGFGTPLPEGMAGTEYLLSYVKELEARANLVAAAEREACAEVCENICEYDAMCDGYYAETYAAAIRARGQG